MVFRSSRVRDGVPTRGQAMVEFALVAPLIALFIVIAVDFGRAFYSHVQIMNGAREAAALGGGQLNGPTDVSMLRDAVLLEANEQDHAGENATIALEVECRNPAGSVIDCGDAAQGSGVGNTVTVTVARDFTFMTPLAGAILGDNFKIRAAATAPVLGLVASGGGGSGGGGCNLPTASFSVTVLAGLLVETDPSASTPQNPDDPCNLSGYYWTWQAGGTEEVGEATAKQHTYANAGTYTITLRVTNQAGEATTTRQVTVPTGTPVECDPPDARFTVSENDRTHTYTDTSTVGDPDNCPITAWLWTGPGWQSNAPNPTHTYGNNGNHSVTLQVTNSGGSDTFSSSH